MARYESVLEAVGGTPLIRLTRGVPSGGPRVYVKPEWLNPGGSVKDRAAVWMLRQAERDGLLRPGGTVVELTSGNTGIGLAMAAAHLGYSCVIFTSSKISSEKRNQITAYGARLELVDTFVPKDHPDSLRSHAERFVEQTPGAWLAAQYDNAANAQAHYETTGPEIWADTDGQVTHVVSTIGTGGTISGTARYLKEISGGRVRVIGADPLTSSYAGGDGSQKAIEGAGHFVHPEATVDIWPTALDLSLIDKILPVADEDAIAAIRELATTEGILAGGSSGVALAAGRWVAADLGSDDVVVILLPDSGRAYLSTYFNRKWLADNGFGTLEDTPSDPAVFVTAQEAGVAAAARLIADGIPQDAPVFVAYPRERRVLAPHPSDLLGWTTPALLRDHETARAAARPLSPDTVSPVLRNGRVVGVQGDAGQGDLQ
ncbi:PLP-dependent cysteine synthase family protein [Branchiibius sp. NY16-3462-2]|uniref:PLP-dependent cysteine synthase family protein n=1 Tax=Branchiibius sp. NY16-3462-2 TaxID=1807500 RepID=UPI000ADA269E|nr:PLP-dependent cysteine synthase family protein [Branchiibius sp. NY16-3462-2]